MTKSDYNSSNIHPFKAKKYLIRVPKIELYYYYTVFTAGTVPYVSPVANGYSDIRYVVRTTYNVGIPFDLGDIYTVNHKNVAVYFGL